MIYKFKTYKRIKKLTHIIKRIFQLILILLILLVITLSIPRVQTTIAKKVTESLNKTYGTQINIDRIGINWKGEVDIRDVFIKDHRNDTLIYAAMLQTNILSLKNLSEGNLDFGFIEANQLKLYVTTYKDEADDNLTIFANSFNRGDTVASTKPFLLLSDKLSLKNTSIKVQDRNLENPLLVGIQELKLDAESFKIEGPNVNGTINKLSFLESRNIEITNLSGNFQYTPTQITLDNLYLETKNSFWNGDFKLLFENGMANFKDNVVFDAIFEDTSISTTDLNKFYNEFGENLNLILTGNLTGTLNDLSLSNSTISYENSKFSGDFIFKNLLNEQVYQINASNHFVSSNFFDLRKLMPNVIGTNLPKELKDFGNFTITGTTSLRGEVLNTNSNITSALGKISTQLEMGNINNASNAYYKGNATLYNVNIGKILATSSFGKVNGAIIFDGKGFSSKSVDAKVTGTIESFAFEDYTYKNILVEGNFKNPIFNGKFSVDDPYLQMEFEGLLDVSKEFNQYDFEAAIEFAELNKLNLFKRDSISVFAGKIRVDMDGTTINNATGSIQFSETFYQTATKDYFFDDFSIIASNENEERTISINSPDIITGEISGKFLIEDIPYLFRNSIGSIYTNFIPIQVTTDQYINYEFEIYNKIIEVFVPQLQLGKNTRIKGTVFSDESKFELDFKSPELLISNNYLGKVNLKLDNNNHLFNAYVSIDSLHTGSYNLTDINLINKTLNDTLYIQTRFNGGNAQKDNFKLAFFHTINPEGNSVLGIKKSTINYLGNEWFINRDNNNLNKITFDDNFKDILLDSLTIRHKNELIQLSGFKQDTTLTDIKLQFKDVDIGKLIPVVDTLNLKGIINGDLNIINRKGAYFPKSEMVIRDLELNSIPLGNLDFKVSGNNDLSKYTIASNLINKNFKSFEANGKLDIAPEKPQIDIGVKFRDFNLEAFSPLGGDVISKLRGLVSGNIAVNGNYNNPNTNGSLTLDKGGMQIPYLNVDFDLGNNSLLFIEKNRIRLSPITITDTKYNTRGILSGFAGHNNFSDWTLGLEISTDNLLVLDTPPDEDELYYGTAFISGTSKINGPVDELVIDVIATTEAGTMFKIPISDAASIGDDSFIRFISPEEKRARLEGETFVAKEIKGLSLNFELDINDNAEVEIIVDPVNNSRLKGRGAGILLLEINTLGKFKMWGDFLITEGKYDLRYGGIVDKTIDVVPGGNITWDGEPTKARLDLTAKYVVEDVNPSGLLDNPNLNTTVDVEVLVNLTGEIMQPDLDFQLYFPRVSSTVKDELEDRLRTKEQRQIQAIFLASSGSFQSDGSAGQNALANTLTERVNKLVADIFADSDSKFKVLPTINTRTVSLDQQLEYQVGVEVSTKLSERILVNGRVAVPVGGANESVVAGDVEVQWLVNNDGSLRINFFAREANIQFIGEGQIFEQGAGVSYSVDFNTFNELMQKIFNKKLSIEIENELPIIPDDNTLPYNFKSSGIKNED